MEPLKLEPTYRVLLGEVAEFRILQVGCGGTGSALALALGGLAYHAREKGIRLSLTLVDDDLVAEGNIGRPFLLSVPGRQIVSAYPPRARGRYIAGAGVPAAGCHRCLWWRYRPQRRLPAQ